MKTILIPATILLFIFHYQPPKKPNDAVGGSKAGEIVTNNYETRIISILNLPEAQAFSPKAKNNLAHIRRPFQNGETHYWQVIAG